MPFTTQEIQYLPNILSIPRFATYLNEKNGNQSDALHLYKWNLEVSSAFIVPLQICEVCVRNGISEAIEATYGANWPRDGAFKISLPDPQKYYSPRRNIIQLRNQPSTGKIIAELKFVFWEKMFTKRHDQAIWNPHFRTPFPETDVKKPIWELRAGAFSALEKIRDLRNRIAHHEPIFRRNIQAEYDQIREVVSWRCSVSADWLDKIEPVTEKIAFKP